MLTAATIYNLAQQLDDEQFAVLMGLYARDERKAPTACKPQKNDDRFPTVEETMERLLAGYARNRFRNPTKTMIPRANKLD